MNKKQKNEKFSDMDSKEIKLPETSYVRDIETKVFQGIVFQCLVKIEGVGLIGGNIIDNWLGRDPDKIKGIYVEQDQKEHSLFIRLEVNIAYGLSIPKKSEEIQSKVIEEITNYTGLHVSCVHVIFKNLVDAKDLIKEEKTEEKENLEV